MARFAGIAGMTLLTLGGTRRDLLSAVIEAGDRMRPAAASDPVGPRMSGGGSVHATRDEWITHGFTLHCDPDAPPNSLDIEWPGGRFHLEAMTSSLCTDDPAIQPDAPGAPFDTCRGAGTGRYNDEEDATVEWTFTDAGASGVEDRAVMTVRDAAGEVLLDVSATLTYGNHEAIE